MRRSQAILLMILALLLAVATAGCGEASKAAPAAEGPSPQAILAAAVAASETMDSAGGSFDVTMSFDADTSQMPAEAKAFLEEPMNVSGTFTYATEPMAGEFDVSLTMAGDTMDVGLKAVDDKFWLSLLDQWYEAPAEMGQMMSQSSGQQAQLDELKSLLDELAIDPVTWFKDLRIVGEETIDGEAVYHLAGTPDMTKMMTDLMTMMQSEKFMGLIDPTGSMGGSMANELMPSPEELGEIQTQLTEMFQDFTIELWVTADDSLLRKAAVSLQILPPAGEDTGGLNAVSMNASVSLADVDGAVKVQPPASSLPFSDLEKAMQEDPEKFLGPLMGLMGGLGGFGGAGLESF